MKRGFLNNTKAKAKLTKDTDRIAVHAGPKPEPETLKRSYGVVENAGKPEGYETKKIGRRELNPLAPPQGLDPETPLYTTQPSVLMGATPSSFPDGWTECLLFPDAKALIFATPGFPAPLVRPSRCNYRLASIPDKGLGLLSTRKISAGELILSERPLTLTPVWISSQIRYLREFSAHEKFQAQLYEWEQTLKYLFERLHPDYQTAFMGLANSHKHDGSGPIGGRIRTNALGVCDLQSGRYTEEERRVHNKGIYSAVCKEISRLNHSCSPNTIAHFDLRTFSFQLFAARDIGKAEELTLSYTSLIAEAKQRQMALEPYGFQCTCAACRKPVESDAYRAMSLSIAVDGIDAGLVKLSLLEKEGLQSTEEYCNTLKSVMDLYIVAGDTNNASKYAGKLANRPWSRVADGARLYTTPLTIQSHPL